MVPALQLDVLRRADAEEKLPRLGGMARPDGVVIVSERFWAFAGVDGSIRNGEMPQPPQTLQRVPLVRGLVRLVASVSPLSRASATCSSPPSCFRSPSSSCRSALRRRSGSCSRSASSPGCCAAAR
jgi:hypothetical protein